MVKINFIRGKWEAVEIEGGIKISPTCPPENSKEEDEWLEIVQQVLALVAGRDLSIISYQSLEEILPTEILDIELPNATSIDELYVTKLALRLKFLRKICESPQFFSSALAIVSKYNYTDVKKFRGCNEKNIPAVDEEYICMNSDGSALYWLCGKRDAKLHLKLLENVMENSNFRVKMEKK
jgi:hypothetical protein